ncbi:acyltransferase [uncultured Georgenia sp.]|uniref:acyltransferase family protein n=1 Tax=uncultured Georgenia sp. TaxID=378209 RepID=UPI002638D26C|nr:acyltransferase [uncultured Georgenia sp.]HLV05933.1 acyltransferase [Actinomycetaceae bacterium]
MADQTLTGAPDRRAAHEAAHPSAPTPRRDAGRPRLYGIDALRFLAALGVMLYHYVAREHSSWGDRLPGEVFPELGRSVLYAALGPELFFVISGFVILMTAWGKDVPYVVASRAARLYPSYWVAVVATSVLLLWVWPGGKDITLSQAVVNLSMVQALVEVPNVDGVYWTLWTELRFYLLILVLVAVGITRRRVLAFCALWPLAAVLAAGSEYPAMVLVSGYAPLFAGGMLLYLIHRDGHAWLPWLLLAGNVVLAQRDVVAAQLESLARNTAYAPSATALTVGVVGCFAAVAATTLTPLRSLRWAWLARLGMLTYPLYLTHEHWGWWLIHLLYPHLGRWPTLLITCGAALAAAWALYHGVEKHVGPRMRRAVERGLRRNVPARRGVAPA